MLPHSVNSSQHRRVASCIMVEREQARMIKAEIGPRPRMHATLTSFNPCYMHFAENRASLRFREETFVLLLGGRESPLKPQSELLTLVVLEENSTPLWESPKFLADDLVYESFARWRHSAAARTVNSIVVSGGRCTSSECVSQELSLLHFDLEAFFEHHTGKIDVKPIEILGIPNALCRHSHTLSYVDGLTAYVYGGLGTAVASLLLFGC